MAATCQQWAFFRAFYRCEINHLLRTAAVTAPRIAMLLTVEQALERPGTSVRFIRRLRTEQRITIIKLGKHVRIDSADPDANRHEALVARVQLVASNA